MKWTYDWLLDYLKTDAAAAQIAERLTQIGLEVEDLSTPIAPVAAKIVECAPLPGSDHLHILQVDDGMGTTRQVVCGAPNARVGLVSALARPGCVIGGHQIQLGKLRGVMSDGMMCSAREMGIGDDDSGIIELDANMALGTPVIDVKTVFDAGITPNRPDYLAVRGIARDLSAAGIGEYITPDDTVLAPVATSRRAILDTDKCPEYRFCEINGIQVAPSCEKIVSRLRAIGINPKNAPVDATNYVCYDMGQPMHCFDADEICGDIVVRMATPGEDFTDLFGTAHKLTADDMVITDQRGILAVAGVVGGARGMTTENTKNIILESAYFDPVSVRKTAKRLGISTDASYRYERGIDPCVSGPALRRAAQIVIDACGGEITGVGAACGAAYNAPTIEYAPDSFAKKMGIELDAATQANILRALGYLVVDTSTPWHVTPPSSRVDAVIAETVIADLARIYGYDKIAKKSAHRAAHSVVNDNPEIRIKQMLASRGLNEHKSFSFGNSAVEKILSDKCSIPVSNPITVDMDTARNGLLGGLLTVVAANENRGYSSLCLFEMGTVFDGDAPGQQHTQICIVRTGQNAPRHWTGRSRNVDIYDVKSDLVALMQGRRFTIDTDNAPAWAHPFRYGALMQGNKKIAEFGELHPMVARALKIKTPVMVALVENADDLPTRRASRDVALSEFQPITRDFAFITDALTPAAKITGNAMAADPRISDVVVFDAFDMGNGKKSIAFTITIQPTQNMSDADLATLQNAVIARVESKCDAHIRDK